nr:tyrosine-protein phosphatase non-receptor type 23 [Leptinotarsa decemlineata]
MEAAPRLPMLSFDLKVPTENTQFAPQLKQYIATFYNEDPESYSTEINNLESLRAAAVRPSTDYNGIQLLKKYYCQLHFLKSRFPMEENQEAAVQFSWKDNQFDIRNSSSDIRFEMMVIMYNIGALHSHLGSVDSRTNSEGMKMACTHFQCAAWAFQNVKEKYQQFITYISLVQLVHFFQQVCLSQAQECILEKSMLDNRKATIIAKVAVQVHNYYRQSLSILESASDDLFRDKMCKEWVKFLQFKIAYYKCVALLFQGQQAEEQQKMGERVAFYQAACEQLEEAKKWANSLKNQKQEINEGLAFTQDVVEGKRKAAKNENEFIYHESVPDKDHLQEVKGASLVKGIPFDVKDPEISGPDIFARLVPMEAHEGASLYSEKKAQMLRQIGELIETKDQALAEFMSSMQLDLLTKMHQATGIPQDLIDRAAALSVRPTATQDLVSIMGKLSNIYQEVESNLNEIDALLKEEDEAEKGYQEIMGKRPPSIIATDLAREAAKYREAHTKANDSNQTLHRAMTAHVANLKIMQMPLKQLQQQLPTVEMPNPNIDEKVLKDLETLVAKTEEMRNQRAMLWAQLRESVHQDDITNALVTKQPNVSRDQLFQQELQKHQHLTELIEQNAAAQDNIRKALVDTYARAVNTRRYIQDILQKRSSTINALVASCDAYEDLVAKVNKGIEFYTKLETNVSKLLQRIKSACKVQQEEREQMLSKNEVPKPSTEATPAAPKLKDYLESRKKNPAVGNYPPGNYLPQGVRPTPLGSEVSDLPMTGVNEPGQYGYAQVPTAGAAYSYGGVDMELAKRMRGLSTDTKQDAYHANYSSFVPQNYTPNTYPLTQTTITQAEPISPYNPAKAYTGTTDSYRRMPTQTSLSNTSTNMQYPDSSLSGTPVSEAYYGGNYHYPAFSVAGYSRGGPSTQQYNIDTYYPQGYAPGQSYQPSGTDALGAGNMQYHPMEYASSVPSDQVKYSYPSTYTSPVPNMASTNAGEATYLSTNTGYYYGASEASGSGTALGGGATAASSGTISGDGGTISGGGAISSGSTISGGGTISGGSTILGGGAILGSYVPPAVGATSNVYNASGTEQANSVKYQCQNPGVSGYYSSQWNSSTSQGLPVGTWGTVQGYQNVAPQVYSGEGYSQQCYQTAASQNSSTSSGAYGSYYGESYASPSYTPQPAQQTPQVPTQQTPQVPSQQTYQVPTQQTPQVPSQQTYQVPTQQTPQVPSQQTYQVPTQQTPQVPSQQTYQVPTQQTPQVPSQQTYQVPTQQTPQLPIQNLQQPLQQLPVATKESNIDLLSGLDFTISQAPLVPQQNVLPAKPAEIKSEGSIKAPVSKEEIPPLVQEVKRPAFKVLPSKPLNNADVKALFHQEVERYEKFVETLTNKTLSGPTSLDVKWKEIQDKQDSDSQKRIVSVARCYPMKNRFPDILPYDYSRVELCGAKDDYINASFVKDVSPYAPPFIVTQSPLSSTIGDFWTMIREQQVELIFCLSNDTEIADEVYWPNEKGQSLNVLNMVISLQSIIVKSHWTERLISVNVPEKRDSRVVMHLQFTSWPGSLFPTKPDPFIEYTLELINTCQQQRCNTHPVVVHCSPGIGKSGLLCLLTAAIFDVTNNANTVPDLAALTVKLNSCRKNILRDREHLKFAYESFLGYMKWVVSQDKLKKKMNEVVPKVKEETKPTTEVVENNIDPLSSLDPFWASKK